MSTDRWKIDRHGLHQLGLYCQFPISEAICPSGSLSYSWSWRVRPVSAMSCKSLEGLLTDLAMMCVCVCVCGLCQFACVSEAQAINKNKFHRNVPLLFPFSTWIRRTTRGASRVPWAPSPARRTSTASSCRSRNGFRKNHC